MTETNCAEVASTTEATQPSPFSGMERTLVGCDKWPCWPVGGHIR